MKNDTILKVGIGCVIGFVFAGLILLLVFGYLFTAKNNNKKNIQYIEIKGKKGDILLHTDMPKDSIKILLGKPDNTSMRSYGNITNETWMYDTDGDNTHNLIIEIENGELKSVMQL